LPYTSGRFEFLKTIPIPYHPHSRGWDIHLHQTHKTFWKPNILKNLSHKLPTQPIVGLFQVYFYSHPPLIFLFVPHRMNNFFCDDYIITAMSMRNKTTLSSDHQCLHHNLQTLSQDLRNHLVRHITEADRSTLL